MHQFAVAEGEAKGRAEGKAEGRAEGEAKGRESLRIAVDTICELFGVELDDERRNTLRRLDVDGLTALLGRLRSERQWPHED